MPASGRIWVWEGPEAMAMWRNVEDFAQLKTGTSGTRLEPILQFGPLLRVDHQSTACDPPSLLSAKSIKRVNNNHRNLQGTNVKTIIGTGTWRGAHHNSWHFIHLCPLPLASSLRWGEQFVAFDNKQLARALVMLCCQCCPTIVHPQGYEHRGRTRGKELKSDVSSWCMTFWERVLYEFAPVTVCDTCDPYRGLYGEVVWDRDTEVKKQRLAFASVSCRKDSQVMSSVTGVQSREKIPQDVWFGTLLRWSQMALHFPSVEFVAMTVIGVAVSYPDPDHPKSKAICSFDVCPSLRQSLCWIRPEFIAPRNSGQLQIAGPSRVGTWQTCGGARCPLCSLCPWCLRSFHLVTRPFSCRRCKVQALGWLAWFAAPWVLPKWCSTGNGQSKKERRKGKEKERKGKEEKRKEKKQKRTEKKRKDRKEKKEKKRTEKKRKEQKRKKTRKKEKKKERKERKKRKKEKKERKKRKKEIKKERKKEKKERKQERERTSSVDPKLFSPCRRYWLTCFRELNFFKRTWPWTPLL